MMHISKLTQFDKWVARYGSKPTFVKNYPKIIKNVK